MRRWARVALVAVGTGSVAAAAGWMSSPEKGAAAVVAAKPPLNFGISVTDVEKSARWYEDNLGMVRRKSAVFPKGKVIILAAPNLEVEIIQHESAVDARRQLNIREDYLARGIFKVGFYVDDLDATVARLKQHKVKFYYDHGWDEELHLKFAIIADDDGNTIQLFEAALPKN